MSSFNSNNSSLSFLRDILYELKIDLIIVGSEDAHQSEYVCSADMRRQFISGFTGSAGTAVILQDKALLWTDGRYFLQAENELSSDWTLMRSGEKNVPDLYDWILQNLAPGQRVGIDAWLFQGSVAKSYSTKFADKGISLVPFDVNPVDIVWKDFGRPSYPSSPVEVVPLSRAGISHLDKIRSLQEQLLSNGTGALLVTMLDEIAWVLNVRGADVEYNPVVISYLVITLEGAVWFVDEVKVTDEAREHLTDKVAIKAYNEVENFLKTLVQAGTKVWVDSMKTNWRLCEAVGSQKLEKMSPVTLPKSIKNSAELDGFRASHIRDGAALTAFIHWLEMTTKANPDGLTEFDASEKLEEFRSRMDLHVGPSFPTIAGFGPNGAIIHYRPEKDTASKIGVDSMFLLDSGAQYRDGTTDVTRTMHFGEATQRMKDCYTAVLKGHIALAALIVPESTIGSRFDCVARMALWKLGLDYNHGTGHGVGVYLNVHEGPQGIGFRKRDYEEGFYEGMTISNEPGYYEPGAFGIRIENLCVMRYSNTPNNFSGRRFLEFETVTMVPIKTDLINVSQLDDSELAWINAYHQSVREKVLPIIEKYFPESAQYLIDETRPLTR